MPAKNSTSASVRFTLFALVIPVAITLAAIVAHIIVTPSLPNPVAIHWGITGAPDGFAAVWVTPLLLAVVGFGIPALLTATAVPALRRGGTGLTYPLLAATSSTIVTLIAVLMTVATLRQIGLDDAASGPGIGPAFAVAVPVALVMGALAWFVQPRDLFIASGGDSVPAADLADGQRVAWVRASTTARWISVAVSVLVGLLAAGAVLLALFSAEPEAAWVMGAVTLLLALLLVANLRFHVRADERGLTVTSIAGWPRFHVPLSEVRSATVISVEPLAEFGGYGMRWSPDRRFGVVLRRGEPLEIERTTGKRFVVTVDDAHTAAGVLTALRERDLRPAP